MTRHEENEIDRDAADWHAQILGGDVDWNAFAHWLDAAPAHQPAYDRIALLDAEVSAWVTEHGMPPEIEQVVEEDRHSSITRRWWLGGAIAASLCALVVGVPHLIGPNAEAPVVYATAGEQRTLELGPNGKVRLDRASQLAMLEDGQVRMDHGAAYFDLRHDENKPLEIRSGGFIVRDIGTRFTVTRSQGRLFVAVEEGLVDVSWQSASPVRLKAGQTFDGEERTGSGEVGTVEPAAVGSWRDGQLVYDNAPLSLVAADLSRYTGKAVEVDPAIAHLKLSGTLLIRSGSDLVDQVTAILPVEARSSDGHIRLVGRPRR
ncbi:MAG: FecR domain-containing protein [Sphingobium sp.]